MARERKHALTANASSARCATRTPVTNAYPVGRNVFRADVWRVLLGRRWLHLYTAPPR